MRAKGMGEFSKLGLHREGLYRSFGGKMSPRFKTVFDVLAALDIQIIARRQPSGR
jgi:probable addiction module antidote protein